MTALAGVLIQPLARRLEARARANSAAIVGLLVLTAGLLLSAVAAHEQRPGCWSRARSCSAPATVCASSPACSRSSASRDDGSLGGLTAVYYALTYLGFASPYLLALAAHGADYALLLVIVAGLALLDDRTGGTVEQPDFPALSRGPERRSAAGPLLG